MNQKKTTTVSNTKTRTSEISIMQKYFTTLSPYRNVTRAIGILASSANKDGAFGSHILHSHWQTLPRRTHLVDIREFLQMTYIQQHGKKVSQLEQKIHYNKIVKHIKCKAILTKLRHLHKTTNDTDTLEWKRQCMILWNMKLTKVLVHKIIIRIMKENKVGGTF